MSTYANEEILVETDWVADHGRDAKVRLVEVDVDTFSYDEGHIQGAIGWTGNGSSATPAPGTFSPRRSSRR